MRRIRLLIMFPLCGVKQANQPAGAYRAHLDEAIATYQGGPPESLLVQLESDTRALAKNKVHPT